jgi:hypothetical protein
MSNLIPAQTRHEIARSIYRDIITGKDFYYVFAGKSFDDVDVPEDTRQYLADIHKNMLLAKRVVPGPNDVVYMIRRKDWESGTVYVEYSDYDTLAYTENDDFIVLDFYVMTDQYKIYKCLQVGRDLLGNALPSTEKPTSTKPEPDILSDGYIWKFMYEVPVLDRIKFLTSEYIPVRNVSDGVNFDVNGVVDSVRIENPGQGYVTPYLVIKGDGLTPTTITFSGDSSVDTSEHTIQYIGHTFITGDAVRYNAGGGVEISPLTNNNVYFIIFYSDRKIRLAETLIDAENGNFIELTPGEGILHSLTPIGTLAEVTTNSNGGISSITVTNSLRGYTHARPVIYDAKTIPYDGSENYDGRITASPDSRLVVGDGTRFTEQLLVGWSITDCPNEIIGVVDTIISDTELLLTTFANFEVSNCKYSAFSGGGFEGTIVLGAETASIINQNVVLVSIHGAIYKVDIVDGGVGYDSATVKVIGDGTGADIFIDPNTDIDENGTIKRVQIRDYGQNYNYARLVIEGLPTQPAVLRANVGPQRGHGFNIAQELFAHSLCISTTISTSNADLFEGNDYRQLGIVKNLKLYNDTQDVDIEYFQGDTGTAAFVITVPEEQYLEYTFDDEIITSTGGVYRVLTKIFDARTGKYKVYLLYIEGNEEISTDTTFTNETTEFENLICTEVETPKFDKNTGTIMYVNEFSPITRTAEQTETIKLFLHF